MIPNERFLQGRIYKQLFLSTVRKGERVNLQLFLLGGLRRTSTLDKDARDVYSSSSTTTTSFSSGWMEPRQIEPDLTVMRKKRLEGTEAQP